MASLSLTTLQAQSVWSNGTQGGDINSNDWVGGSPSGTGSHTIAQVGANPTNNPQNSSNVFLGLNLAASAKIPLTDASGNYVDQIGALQITSSRNRVLYVGVDVPNSAGTGNGILELNGATINGVSNVVIDEEATTAATTGVPLTFQGTVGTSTGNDATFGLELGTPAVSGNNTFVVKAAAGGGIAFNVPISEAVAGSSVNFLGGGSPTAAGAVITLAPSRVGNGYTGGTVLGNSSQTSLADASGVILKPSTSGLPSTGNVTVNNGSTLWLSSTNGFGFSTQTFYLNGNGSLNSGNIARDIPTTSDLGALMSDAGGSFGTTTVSANIDLQSDSSIAVVRDASLQSTLVISGTVVDLGGLTKVGSGVLDLSAANTYSGGTVINAGTVQASNNSALGASNSGVQINNGGTLSVDAGVQITQTNVALAYGGNYMKNYGAGESLANSMHVQSANGLTASLAAGQAGSSGATLTANFATAAPAGTVTGETVNVSGFGTTLTAYTLQLNLNPALIDGNALISVLDPESGLWTAAVGENTGNVAGSSFFDESFSQFESTNGITDANLANFLGDYGTDASTGQTWAILNYDGQFSITDAAAVPEPSTWVYMLSGLSLLMWKMRSARSSQFKTERLT